MYILTTLLKMLNILWTLGNILYIKIIKLTETRLGKMYLKKK